jgi:hypothetical protein
MDDKCVPEKPKPSIYLSDQEASKFDKYDVDDVFTITAKVRVSSKSKRSYKDSKGKVKMSRSIDLELSDIETTQNSESKLRGKEF